MKNHYILFLSSAKRPRGDKVCNRCKFAAPYRLCHPNGEYRSYCNANEYSEWLTYLNDYIGFFSVETLSQPEERKKKRIASDITDSPHWSLLATTMNYGSAYQTQSPAKSREDIYHTGKKRSYQIAFFSSPSLAFCFAPHLFTSSLSLSLAPLTSFLGMVTPFPSRPQCEPPALFHPRWKDMFARY